MKIVINACFGGFELSHEGVMRYAEIKGLALYPFLDYITRGVYKEQAVIGNLKLLHHYSQVPLDGLSLDQEGDPILPSGAYFSPSGISRTDPALIQTVEELKDAANGKCAALKIVEIPDGVEWEIEEYDGNEHIAEIHRIWN